MGTRRSRHNKGRKPFYKEHRRFLLDADDQPETAADILAVPAGPTERWYQWRAWEPEFDQKLEILAAADADIDRSGIALGRSPQAVAWRARELRLELPRAWASLIQPRKPSGLRQPRVTLAYPYIAKARDDHADVLAVNDLVPKSLPAWMRADVCQNILVALYEGKTSIAELTANAAKLRWFIKKYYREQAPNAEVSITPMDDADGHPYDEIRVLGKDWWQEDEISAKRRMFSSLERLTPATQLDAVFAKQIAKVQERAHARGRHLSFSETATLLEDAP